MTLYEYHRLSQQQICKINILLLYVIYNFVKSLEKCYIFHGMEAILLFMNLKKYEKYPFATFYKVILKSNTSNILKISYT